MKNESLNAVDPPMEPMPGSVRWFESGPEAILNDERLAVLVVRLGMASNALSAQFHAGADASRRRGAVRVRDLLLSLVTSAAVTNEAIKLTQTEMATLRKLAQVLPSPPGFQTDGLLREIGQLCSGKHPASPLLNRARSKLGFHWDEDVIAAFVREYGRNQKLIWIEANTHGHPVHRLAMDVSTHALLPGPSVEADETVAKQVATNALAQINGAMTLIVRFFAACTYGYMKRCGAVRGTRPRVRGPKRRATIDGHVR